MVTKKLGLVAQTSSESVQKNTGKTWDEWTALLNKTGAHLLSHKEIVALLKKKYELTPWWQQIVASGFEQAIGRKIEGQNARGLYSVTAVKTIPLKSTQAWKLLTSDEGVALWLKPLSPVSLKAGEHFESEGSAFGEIRVVKKGSQIRFRWQETDWDRTSVVVMGVIPRPRDKCMITFSQTDIPNARVRETYREHWKLVIDDIVLFINK